MAYKYCLQKDVSNMAVRQTSGHRLKNNDCSYLPRYLICYDTETYRVDDRGRSNEFSHRLRLWTAIFTRFNRGRNGSRHEASGNSASEFWAFVYSKSGPRHTLWVVAHSAMFDAITVGLPTEIECGRLVLDKPRSKRDYTNVAEHGTTGPKLCVIDAPPVILGVRCVKTGGRIVFVDTLNWFRCPLSELGSNLGLQKLDMPPERESDDNWLTYCQRDTEILNATFCELRDWVKSNNMGMFRYTASGQAMSAFRHRFQIHDILIHDNADAKELERRSYFGARTEVFKRGSITEDVWQYDVNSLFPYAMKSFRMPWRLVETDFTTEWREPFLRHDNYDYVAEVELQSDISQYPLRVENHVVYPIGVFKTVLAGQQLADAFRSNSIRAIKSWCRYDTTDLFSKWVDEMYAMRLSYKSCGNTLYDRFTKSLLNSLYGKFGQLGPDWEYCSNDMSAMPWSSWQEIDSATGETQNYRSFGYDIFRQTGKKEIASSFVAIATFVTSAARSCMEKIRLALPRNSVIYMGCDSLIVNAAGKQRLENYGVIHATELGKLKLECQGNFGNIFGCHDYTIGGKTVIAGRSGRLTDIGCQRIMQHRFSKSADLFNGSAQKAIVERVVSWTRSQHYGKGNVGKSGWIQPFVMNGCSSVSADMSAPSATNSSPIAFDT